MTKKKKPKLTDAERSKNARFVVNALICPHKWSEPKKQRVRHSDSKRKPYEANVSECASCGTVRVDRGDGHSALYPGSDR